MTLPSLEALATWTDNEFAALRAQLERVGLDGDAASRLLAPLIGLDEPLLSHACVVALREQREPVAAALRALCFIDPIDDDEARAVFGELLGPVREVGLLVEAPAKSGWVSPFRWTVGGAGWLLADDLRQGGDAVMGTGRTTEKLARYACPASRVARVLDLGCGAGALAIALAPHADRVIATDVNPRALALTVLNTRLNGISNVEVREGSLFEPVAGERFDLVVSQPPFLAKTHDAGEATFAWGGARGDELPLALIAGLDAHLAHEGLALLFIEWPVGEPVSARVRQSLRAPERDLLVLESGPIAAAAHSALVSAAEHAPSSPAFAHALASRLRHFRAVRIDAMLQSVIAVGSRVATGGRTETLRLPSGESGFEAEALRAVLRSFALLRTRDLLDRTLRGPEGIELEQRQRGIGADVPSTIAARPRPGSLRGPVLLREQDLAVLTAVHEAPRARDALGALAERYEIVLDEATLLAAVRELVGAGILVEPR